MRVLHVTDTLRRSGVTARILEQIRHAGPGVQNSVCALAAAGSAAASLEAAGATLWLPAAGREWFDSPLVQAMKLVGLLRRERISVVHAHGTGPALVATLAAVRARVPVILRTEHEPDHPDRLGAFPPLFESLATRFTSKVLCTCEAVRLSHAVRMPWAGDRFVTVHGGVSAPAVVRPRAAVRAELGLLDSDRMVLWAGSLEPWSAPQVLVEAFRRLSRRMSGVQLMIAGEGSRRAALEHDIAEMGLAEHVRFLGDREDVADLMEAADVFALTALRAGQPVALLEAMRSGCPVVATRVGGVPETVVDGETGWIVPPLEPAATADAVLNVLLDRGRARAFSAAARDRWSRGFTGERMVSDIEHLMRAELASAREQGARRAREDAAAWSDAPEHTTRV